MRKQAILLAGMAAVMEMWGVARADLEGDIRYTELAELLGEGVPTGAGVYVGQVESALEVSDGEGGTIDVYMPDTVPPTNFQFLDVDLINATGDAAGLSAHSTAVASLFFGNTASIAPDISHAEIYEANDFLGGGYLRTMQVSEPKTWILRVINHSWVGHYSTADSDLDALKRMDYLVENDETLNVAGVNNGITGNTLLANAYNVIAVGRTDGGHAVGTVLLGDAGAMYSSGRTAPQIVAPRAATSFATPVVSSAVALLIETGHTHTAFSNGYQSVNGQMIYNAETSEVIKAALMAGADRNADFTINTVPHVWTATTDNNLDSRFGAGELDVYNSYQIIAGGESDSTEDAGSQTLLAGEGAGFDYDPSFGAGDTGTYYFQSGSSGDWLLSATLAWNITITDEPGGKFSPIAELKNFDLYLYDDATSDLIASSTSTLENTENLYLTGLDANTTYRLEVVRDDSYGSWDYGLAWMFANLSPVVVLQSDFNGDGVVDVIDLGILAGNWQMVGTPTTGDASGDGFVDVIDLGILAGEWQTTAGSDAFAQTISAMGFAATPEPGTALLGMSGVVVVFRRRRRAA